MRVLLVTTWDVACGVAEHSALLKEAVEAQGVEIEIESNLHPSALFQAGRGAPRIDLVHLNYHAALHSQWKPEHIRELRAAGTPVVITYHDTGVPNSQQCLDLYAVADAFVVHEPCADLPKAIYWRQGVPGPESAVGYYPRRWPSYDNAPVYFKAWAAQPVVGTVGFPFPWKHYDLLAEASAAAGWALVLLAPGATEQQVATWRALNPASLIRTDFVPRQSVVAHLAGCDATAFLYANANTGTSGAIRQGLAARKPVIATDPGGCRQFRDLVEDPVMALAVRWQPSLTVEAIAGALSHIVPGPVDARVVRAAQRDSWTGLGQRYAALYQQLAAV